MRGAGRYRQTLVGFVTLVAPLVLLWYHGRPRQEPTIYEKTVARFTGPAQNLMSNVIGTVRLIWGDYIWLVGVQQDSRELRTENEALRGQVQDREQLKKENQRLKKLLKFKGERPDLVTVAARVVAKDVSPFHRVLKVVLSAGAEHGVRRNQAVITPAGVVGHVERSVGRYAEVKLAVDTGSRISVNVADRDIKGIVAGAGDRNTYLASFETTDPRKGIQPGDMLVTNGEDERFPKGLVVGYVGSEAIRGEDSSRRYSVIPSVDLTALEFVLVVTSQVERIPSMEGNP
jgi:rod shape-determining protein MreC